MQTRVRFRVPEANSPTAGGPDEEPSEGVAPEVGRDILASYYRSAAQFRRLSAQEELSLARRIHAGLAAAEQLASNPAARLDDLTELLSDGKRARDTLIEANLLLVPFVAKTIEGKDQLPLEGSDPGRQPRTDARRREIRGWP